MRVPAEIFRVDIEDAGPGHGGRGGGPQVGDLEDQSHVGSYSDPLIAGQGQDLVVVHHGVEGLDPLKYYSLLDILFLAEAICSKIIMYRDKG